MKKVQLTITGIQVRPDGSGTILTKVGANNPSPSGAFVQSAGQMERLASRAGLGNAIVLKHVAALGAVYTADVEERKAGDVYINPKTKEEGIIQKDHLSLTNDEIVLSPVAQAKVAEVALSQVFGSMSFASSAPAKATASVDADSSDEPAEEQG